MLFQSAPLTEARGDGDHPMRLSSRCSFNPLPSPKQGETPAARLAPRGTAVSIRSPHRSKGRPIRVRGDLGRRARFNPLPSPKQGETCSLPNLRFDFCLFQSAPLTEARGDAAAAENPLGLKSFNPLPSPKQGETEGNAARQEIVEVSIRSPHRSKGRQKAQSSQTEKSEVSIRSPHRSKGRPPPRPLSMLPFLFQSAPLTEARGDV